MRLSKRQLEVLQGAADGETVKQTANRLGISKYTTDQTILVARKKLQATTKTHAVAIAIRQGEID